MANEERKDFNAMLHRETDMPRIQLVTDEATIRKYGGERMLLAPPLAYDAAMRQVPFGRLITVGDIRAHLARTSLTRSRRAYSCPSRPGPAASARRMRRPGGAR